MSATWRKPWRCCGQRQRTESPKSTTPRSAFPTPSAGCGRRRGWMVRASSPPCSTISMRPGDSRCSSSRLGELRVGINARLAKQALADAFGLEVEAVEEVWHGLAPPYLELFAWAEGRGDQPGRPRHARVPTVHARPSARRNARVARRLCGRVEVGRHPHPAGPFRRRDPALQPDRRRYFGQLSRCRRGLCCPRRARRRVAGAGQRPRRRRCPWRSRGELQCASATARPQDASAARCCPPTPPSSGSTTSCSTATRTSASGPGTSGGSASKPSLRASIRSDSTSPSLSSQAASRTSRIFAPTPATSRSKASCSSAATALMSAAAVPGSGTSGSAIR